MYTWSGAITNENQTTTAGKSLEVKKGEDYKKKMVVENEVYRKWLKLQDKNSR